MARPRVLLADHHQLLRDAFTHLLAAECDVVGAVANGRAVLTAAPRLRPDVVLLDVATPLLEGFDTARELRQLMPEVRVIFLTMNEDPAITVEAFRVGASGYLLMNSAAAELFQAIREVIQGHAYVTPQATRGLVATLLSTAGPKHRPAELSERQQEVLGLLAEGRTMKEIARTLKITPRTVAFHKYAMMEQLGVRSSAELLQYAIRHLIPPC